MKIKRILRGCVCALCVAAVLLCSACSLFSSEQPTEQKTTKIEGPLTVSVTLPEGSTCVQIAATLEENGVCGADEFIAAVNDESNLALLPISIDNSDERAFLLEGYVFPDTYEFYCNTSGQSALEKFLENTRAKLTDSFLQRATDMGYTLDEIITLASIIQEEAGDPDEMPNVSAVIHNRLDSSDYPYIQCDVAVVYLETYVKPYFSDDEYDDICDLYNIVRKRKGLPAGAITNPGIDAIEAALYPSDTDYYYFVTDSDGNYYYAETYSQHRDNCEIAGISGNY